MRKETSAALIAGVVSALPVGALVGVAEVFFIWKIIPSLPNQNPVMLGWPIMAFLSGFMILMMVAIAALWG